RMQDEELSDHYRHLLVDSFPTDKNAVKVANPRYEQIARDGKHMEDSLYAATYTAYQNSEYRQVARNFEEHTRDFAEGPHRARILFVQAMSCLYSGDRKQFLALLEELTSKYSKEEIATMAADIVKGVKEGRLLSDSKYDSSDIWKRRKTVTATGDSIAPDTLKDDRYSTFNFVIAYPTNSLDEDQLLYEMARYNFTSYMVRNFEIEVLDDQGLSMMCVRGFLSFDEAHAYAQRLYADAFMRERLDGLRTLLISDENLKLLGTAFSFDEYKEFYDRTFAPIDVPKDLQFDEPTDIPYIDPDDYVPEPEGDEDEGGDDYDDFPFGF
ncbi:MAG: hypothetical protein HUK02_07940, partial [Bacteroidaceae bacterium]|nr:hypothetical protein [Bacteroidaceae bacterium]